MEVALTVSADQVVFSYTYVDAMCDDVQLCFTCCTFQVYTNIRDCGVCMLYSPAGDPSLFVLYWNGQKKKKQVVQITYITSSVLGEFHFCCRIITCM